MNIWQTLSAAIVHSVALPGLLVVSLAAVGCNGMKSPSTAGASGKPKIMIVGGDSVSWGRVSPGTLQRELKIVNVGGDTLRISDVHPSCGCTTAPLDRKNLGPGDTGVVKISLDALNRKGDLHKSISITTNDSARPRIDVPLTAFVVREMELYPDFFPVVDSAKPGVERATTITVRNIGDKPVKVDAPFMQNAPEMVVWFDQTAPKELAPGDSMKVTAHVKPIKAGTTSAEVIFNTDSKNSPILKAMITCTVREQR
ncbi:MAG TPA: DUF1573 domain-containing protein [Candidatus Kapabacteria bacterium]|nr:DUF1573 domain-containing protein [Candidatus Kapabacteria bacterium]